MLEALAPLFFACVASFQQPFFSDPLQFLGRYCPTVHSMSKGMGWTLRFPLGRGGGKIATTEDGPRGGRAMSSKQTIGIDPTKRVMT